MAEYTNDYLLNRQVKIFQPVDGYRASTDAVILSSLVQKVKKTTKFLMSAREPAPFPCASLPDFRKYSHRLPE